MATFYVEIVTSRINGFGGEPDTFGISATCNGSPLTNTDRLTVAQGDYVRFKWLNHGGNGSAPPQVLISGFRSQVWTATGNVSLTSIGQSVTRRVSTSAELGGESLSYQQSSGGGIVGMWFDIVDDVDTVPDSYSLGANQTNLYPSSEYFLPAIKVTGINASTNITCSGTGFSFRVGTSSTYVTSASIGNNAWIYPRFIAQSDFNQSRTVSMSIGGVYRSVVLGTLPGEDVEKIPFPYAKTDMFGLREIADFFGIAHVYNVTNINFGDYYRAGNAVPNISPENDDITHISQAGSTPLGMREFGGSVTTLYFKSYPKNKLGYADSSSGPAQARVAWNVREDYDAGYGTYIENIVDVRYKVVIEGSRPSILEIYPFDAEDAWSQWFRITAYDELAVSMTAPEDTEWNVHGKIFIQLRHPNDPAGNHTVEAQANFVVTISGP